MKELTEEIIRSDNPHFGPVIRNIEEGPCSSSIFDFTYYKTVGAHNSKMGHHITGESMMVDAWATYLWSPSKQEWILGSN